MLPIKVIRSTPAAGINNSIRSCIRGNTSLLKSNIFTARNSSCGKVMFSQASVCSGGGSVGGIGISHASWTYPTPFWTYLLLTSGGHLWRPVQTCSLKALISPPQWYWHLVALKLWLASGMLSCSLKSLRPYISIHYSKWKHVPSLFIFLLIPLTVTIFRLNSNKTYSAPNWLLDHHQSMLIDTKIAILF